MNRQTDFNEFSLMLTAIGEMYSKNVSEWTLALWWNALQEYDFAMVKAALDGHIKNPDTGQFMPKPADVVRMVAGTTQDQAFIAKTKVERWLRGIPGPSNEPDDPIIELVIADMGGRSRLRGITEKEWQFAGKEFEKRYQGYARLTQAAIGNARHSAPRVASALKALPIADYAREVAPA